MASNGLIDRAKKGKCRICLRVRCTEKHVKPVGEVRHGFGTGHIWQCKNTEDCDRVCSEKLKLHPPGSTIHETIKFTLSIGRT